MKLNDVQKRLLSQKQVKKPYMMKGGTLPKAQMGDPDEIRNPLLTRRPLNPTPPPQVGQFNPYENMDSPALANVYQDLYGGMRFINTGGLSQDEIMQKFIESQGTFNPRREFRIYDELMPKDPRIKTNSPGLTKKKGGRIKGSGSNGVL